MLLRFEQRLANALDQLRKRRAGFHVHAQCECVQIQANLVFQIQPFAAGDRSANYQVLLSSVAMQQSEHAGQQQHERTHTAVSAERAYGRSGS